MMTDDHDAGPMARRNRARLPARVGRRAAIGLVLLLGARVAQAEPIRGHVLTGPEIRAALLGNTISGTTPYASTFDMWIAPDGKLVLRGSLSDGSLLADIGVATIEGDRWCVVMEKRYEGKKLCQTVARDGEQYRNYGPGQLIESTYTVRKGNVLGW